MLSERELAIHPIVQESVEHNTRVLSTLRSLTASLFGIAAGILGLESYPGFLFYFVGTFVISLLVWLVRASSPPTSPASPKTQTTHTSSAAPPRLTASARLKEEKADKKASGAAGSVTRRSGASQYFQGGVSEILLCEVLQGLSSFVLTWTLFFGLIRA